MSETKTSTIQEVGAVRMWAGPNGDVFYHTIQMANGDKGSIGKKTEGALKIGDTLTYTIELSDKGNKIKEVRENNFNGGGFKANGGRGSTASFALSYCKDICVALIPLHPDKTPTDWTNTTLAMADRFNAWLKEHE